MPLLSQLWAPKAQPRKDHNVRSKEVSGGCNNKGKDAVSDQNYASGTSQGSNVLGELVEKRDALIRRYQVGVINSNVEQWYLNSHQVAAHDLLPGE